MIKILAAEPYCFVSLTSDCCTIVPLEVCTEEFAQDKGDIVLEFTHNRVLISILVALFTLAENPLMHAGPEKFLNTLYECVVASKQ